MTEIETEIEGTVALTEKKGETETVAKIAIAIVIAGVGFQFARNLLLSTAQSMHESRSSPSSTAWMWSSTTTESCLCACSASRLFACRGLSRGLGDTEAEREREREREDCGVLGALIAWVREVRVQASPATLDGSLGCKRRRFFAIFQRYIEMLPRLRETFSGFSDYVTHPRPSVAADGSDLTAYSRT